MPEVGWPANRALAASRPGGSSETFSGISWSASRRLQPAVARLLTAYRPVAFRADCVRPKKGRFSMRLGFYCRLRRRRSIVAPSPLGPPPCTMLAPPASSLLASPAAIGDLLASLPFSCHGYIGDPLLMPGLELDVKSSTKLSFFLVFNY